jgi:hypothetical protein
MTVKTVKAFKTVNGDEFLAKVDNETDQSYFVSNPVFIMVTNTGEQQGVSLSPALPYVEEGTIEIMKSSLSFRGNPVKQLEDEYNRTFDEPLIELIQPQKIIV